MNEAQKTKSLWAYAQAAAAVVKTWPLSRQTTLDLGKGPSAKVETESDSKETIKPLNSRKL